MTISTTIIKNSYSGNGSTTAFTYNFKITAETEIEVIVKTNATGAESVRSIGTGSTNYAVSGVGNNSGTVTFVTAPTSSETVLLMIQCQLIQLKQHMIKQLQFLKSCKNNLIDL